MKELIEFIAKSLVDDENAVVVNQSTHGSRVKLELKVAKEDMGRVIGKNGRIINSIRTLLRISAEKENRQVTLDVVEP